MNRPLLFAVVAVSLFLAAPRSSADEANGQWKAALGSVSITPDTPVWMAGYASRDKPSDGAVHDLFAKVLVVEDFHGNRIAVVTTDLIGITPELRAGVEAIATTHGVPAGSLLMNASHTHCGPELRGDRLARFGIDATYAARAHQYVREITAKIGRMIGETAERLEPARLVYSHARAGFAMNRRLPTPGGFINSPNPDGPVDHRVPVIKVLNDSGQIKGILFGYACHATTLSFQQLCGDYPGFAQQYLEDSHPGAVALFLNGCSGDQNPYPRRTLDLAKQHGRALANAVETALETKRTQELSGSVRAALEPVTLRFAGPPTREEVIAEVESNNKYTRIHGKALLDELEKNGSIRTQYEVFPIQVIQLGSQMTIVAICGEVVVDYSLRLQKELPQKANSIVWVAGYSNHVFGYLPSRRILNEGGYEGARAMQYTTFPGPFDESVEQRVVAKVKQLVSQVNAPADR